MNPNGNGNKPVSPEIDATPERDRERDESLGRFRSAESRARSLANLKPADSTRAYQLGQLSGERRANDALFKQELLSVLKAKMPKDKQGRTYRRAVAESLVKIALKGGLARLPATRASGPRSARDADARAAFHRRKFWCGELPRPPQDHRA